MPTDTQPIRYAIYTRQSVERPIDFSSCDAQFLKCQLFIERENENLVWVGQRFDDEGESSGSLDRPALTRLRDLVRAGGVDRMYVTALDRLARSVSRRGFSITYCGQRIVADLGPQPDSLFRPAAATLRLRTCIPSFRSPRATPVHK